jgi:hypothetical protein
MLDRHPVFGFDPDWGLIEGSRGIAASMGMALAVFADRTRAAAIFFQIGNVCSLIVIDAQK